MAKTKARELLEEAAVYIDRYKHPGIDEAEDVMDKIFIALCSNGLDGVRVEGIEEYDGKFHVTVSWTCRGCYDSDVRTIPSSVIDAEDPIKAATAWRHDKSVRQAEVRYSNAKKEMDYASHVLEKAHKERDEWMALNMGTQG